MILPFDDLKKWITLNTGFFETSGITEDDQMRVVSGNHDGAGLSAGNLQYNWGAADRLQELFLYMLNNHDSIVQAAFGTNTAEYTEFNNVVRTYSRVDRVTWGNSISIPTADGDNLRYIYEPWRSSFANFLITPECKAKYYSMRDAYYWNDPYFIFRQMSCKSRAALATFFDLMINKGRYYPINLLQVDFDEIDANTTIDDFEKERQKIYIMNVRANEEENALNDTSSSYFAQRRNCMRDQGGVYYGTPYDPEVQFNVTQDTAIVEKESGINVKLGSANVNKIFLGTAPINKIYLGDNELIKPPTPFTTATAPQTQFRTNPNSYLGIGAATSVNLTTGQPLWIDVQNFVACRTYYTIDGSTPTTDSTLYTQALTFTSSVTLKVLTVSIFGVAEAIKTLSVVVSVAPTTTISPSQTIQNNIPITITLTTDEVGAAIKYRLGSGATVYNYTAPFEVNQNTTGVASTNIKVTYWAVGSTATEAEKSITYDTSGAIPAKPTVTVTNGQNQVKLDWLATANTTSYNVYRSTTLGTLGTLLSQYQTTLTYTDTSAVSGTTYYYTVRSGNYGRSTDSDQVSGSPIVVPTKPTYRYIRIDGYGEFTGSATTTTRMIEVEVFSGGINRAAGKVGSTDDPVNTGGQTGSTTPSMMTDGTKSITSNTYNIWWDPTPNAFVVLDLGAAYPIDSIRYWAYTARAARFKIWGTNNRADFGAVGAISGNPEVLWDMSLNEVMFGSTAGTNNYMEKTF